MTQADSVYSTPPTNTSANNIVDPSRRGFLAQAAVVAAGGAALGMALPLPVSAGGAERVPDPIHAAIEAHKAAYADFVRAVDALNALESEIMAKGSRLSRDRDEDPRVAELEEALSVSSEAETGAACALVTVRPTTIAGLMALLKHALAHDKSGEAWPSDLQSDDGDERLRPWHYFLVESVADSVPGIVGAV